VGRLPFFNPHKLMLPETGRIEAGPVPHWATV